MSASTRARGRKAEAEVAAFLEARGLEIVDRNAVAGGVELDLVATEGQVVVFVEVRSRRDEARGSPLSTVGPRKRARLVRGASAWLVAHGLWERVAVRFDVVGVTAGDGEAPRIEWIPGAFEADGR